jgi:uncharacterized protein
MKSIIYVRKQFATPLSKNCYRQHYSKKAKRRRKSTKFHQYFDWSEPLSKAPSHRLLAMLRAVNEGFVKLKIELMLMPLTYNR